ncbi:MAG: hypothetical protein A2Z25_19480 [Planctomycetes bacterium RBG_16_55_9]|nr:MAG: hypothetical protein A2Z25_19480 [Planctomycetes bacterium RBG_16_55_9]
MNQIRTSRTSVKSIILTCVVLLASASLAWAADDITGTWEMTMDFGGRPSYATLSIAKQADGSLTGKWGSDALSNVKFQDGKLTFVRTIRFGDQEFTMNYNGVLKDGKIEGLMSSDRGEFAVNGARRIPKLPILGQWDLSYRVMDQDVTAKLTVSQRPNGALDATWTSQFGESTISNVKFQDGKLSFTRKVKLNDNEFEMTFEGAVQGDKLTGVSKNDQLEVPVAGQRVGAALIGQWDITSTSEMGTRRSMMRIETDLTGRYESFGGEIPMKDLKLDGDRVTFSLEMGFGDQTFKLDFKGKLDGKTLKGEMVSERGTSQIAGKKIEAASSVVGTWEFTRQIPDGTRTSTLKINDDMTGTYSFRDSKVAISDLVVEGDQVSFKIDVKLDDREFRMDFKGKVDGDTLKGVFTTERGAREAAGKRVN